MFERYSPIENTYQERYINKILDNLLHEKCEWQVFEKVDGANFCFVYDGSKMHCAKRTSILTEGDRFFDYSGVKERYSKHVIDFYEKLKLDKEAIIYVYGELYGGYYPDIESDSKPINKNVYYSPEIDFIAFDVYLKEDPENPGRWMAYEEYVHLLVGVPVIEPLFMGSFQEALDFKHEFITRIPSLHKLPEVEGNLAEGIVIKPTTPLHFKTGERIVLKKKIEKFSEKRIVNKTPRAAEASLNNHPVIEYITENRLHNVISKLGLVTQRDMGLVMKDFTADILDDYQKEHDVDAKELKSISKIVGKESINIVKGYFRKQESKEEEEDFL